MGELIELAHYRADRSHRSNVGSVAVVFFALGSASSYLTVERVERVHVLASPAWVFVKPA